MNAIPEIVPPDLPLVNAEERLHDIARAITGLEDFGDSEYVEGLRTLLRSFDQDADLSPAGHQRSAGMVLTALAGRLISEAGWAAHPDYREIEIPAPIIIIGLPRTATTSLHRLLSRDPRHQGPELWLTQSPQPRPPRERWAEDPTYKRCVDLVAKQQEAAPELSSIHEMDANEPDECWNLLRQSFTSVTFECAAGVRGYARWWENCDMTCAYRRWADNLRLIGLEDRDKRWILKDPSHLFAADALLETVPDAIFVMTHRDPAKSIPSVCSLTATARNISDRIPDPIEHGREQLALWARGIECMERVRERHAGRFVDVHFHEFSSNPLMVLERIYEHAGEPFLPAARAAMDRWLSARTPRGHRYEAEQFGLVDEEVRERFSAYIQRYDVQLES